MKPCRNFTYTIKKNIYINWCIICETTKKFLIYINRFLVASAYPIVSKKLVVKKDIYRRMWMLAAAVILATTNTVHGFVFCDDFCINADTHLCGWICSNKYTKDEFDKLKYVIKDMEIKLTASYVTIQQFEDFLNPNLKLLNAVEQDECSCETSTPEWQLQQAIDLQHLHEKIAMCQLDNINYEQQLYKCHRKNAQLKSHYNNMSQYILLGMCFILFVI